MKNETFSRYGRPLSLLIFGAGSAAGALFWLNNLQSAVRYHAALFSGRMMKELPSGFLPTLDWSTADVSTVTTFIPFFGFLLMFLGCRRIKQRETWPFFAGYDRLNVALGLLGTLWGIILIGYYPADRVTIPALMSCLHTAMFSTLAAIAWVMVLEPLLFRPWLNALRRQFSGGLEAGDGALEAWLDALTGQLQQLSGTLAAAGRAAADFQKEMTAVHQELAQEREAGTLYRKEMLACLEKLAAATEELQQDGERLVRENRELANANAGLAAAKSALEQEKTALVRDNADLAAGREKLTEENAALVQKNARLDDANAGLTSDLAQAQETLAKIKLQLEAVRSALR